MIFGASAGSFLLYKLLASQGMDLSDVVFSKERTDTLQRPDEDVEKNMVALEEALEVSDKKSLRTLMMNVIRGDYKHSLSAIALALNSEDSETAHYAASVLQEVLNDFRTGVHERYRLCLVEDEKQAENCIHLIEYMNPIIEQKVLTDLEQHSMAERMDEVLEKAWILDSQKISSTMHLFIGCRVDNRSAAVNNKRSSVPGKDNLLRLRDYVQITLYGGCRAAGCE